MVSIRFFNQNFVFVFSLCVYLYTNLNFIGFIGLTILGKEYKL
jgi:hypothetical protein